MPVANLISLHLFTLKILKKVLFFIGEASRRDSHMTQGGYFFSVSFKYLKGRNVVLPPPVASTTAQITDTRSSHKMRSCIIIAVLIASVSGSYQFHLNEKSTINKFCL